VDSLQSDSTLGLLLAVLVHSKCSRQSQNERVGEWSSSVPNASVLSAPESDTPLDETESSLTDTTSTVGKMSAAATILTGPRYSNFFLAYPHL
jgi:hypothetical protein